LTDENKCRSGENTQHQCPKPARAAIKLTDGVRTTATLYFDDREAPKNAVKYCKEHAVATIVGFGTTFIESDD
jgi:hypothetical protein